MKYRGLVIFLAYGLLVGLVIISTKSVGGIDDAYYYLKIAEHLARGDGPTFDGLHLTNGYHPLWLSSLVPLYGLSLDPDTIFRLALALQTIFFSISVGFFYLTARIIVSRSGAAVATMLWALFTYRPAFSGMEFGLYAMFIVLVGWIYLRLQRSRNRLALSSDSTDFVTNSRITVLAGRQSDFILGIFCALLFLARLEAVLLGSLIALRLGWREWRGGWPTGALGRLAAFGLPLAITVIVYAGLNWFWFGHIVSVSSAIKRDWSSDFLAQDPVYLEHGWLAAKVYLVLLPVRVLFSSTHPLDMIYPFYLVVGGLGAGLFWLLQFSRPNATYRDLDPFLLFGEISLVAYAFVYHGWATFAQAWYFAIQPWLAALFVGIMFAWVERMLEHADSRLRRSVGIAGLVLVCLIPMYHFRQLGVFAPATPRAADPMEHLADWVRVNTPPDAVIGSWNAGIVSFYSGRRVINLDGLVNSWDYYDRDEYDLCAYWQKNNVTYLADGFEDDRAVAPSMPFPFYERCVDRLRELWKEEVPGYAVQIKVYKIEWQ